MSFDGNGNFIRLMNWVNDAVAGIKIKADRHDLQDDDFAAGLSNAITKDGQSQPVNNIPMNDHRLINLADPVNDQDAATKKYADTIKPSTSGFEISGADNNGKLTFSSLTGVNGLSWAGADLSWIARLAEPELPGPPVVPAKLARLCLNDKADGTGTDVVVFSDDGTGLMLKDLTVSGKADIAGAATIGGAVTVTGMAAFNGNVRVSGTNANMILSGDGNTQINFTGPGGTPVRAQIYTAGATQGNLVVSVNGTAYQFGSNAVFYVGGAYINTAGNIVGSQWSSWGANDAFSAINARIESRAQAWAASAVNGAVTSTRMAGVIQLTVGTNTSLPSGYVQTGMHKGASYDIVGRQPQILIPAQGWLVAFAF